MLRTQMVTTVILGIWLGWTAAMWFAATRSFRTVDRVLKKANPQFEQTVRPLGNGQARAVLRYLASEINRAYFAAYGWSQMVLGIVLLVVLWRQAPRDTIALVLAGVMLGLVVILSLVMQPMIVSLGRTIDFVPRNPPPNQMPRFWMLHGAFSGL